MRNPGRTTLATTTTVTGWRKLLRLAFVAAMAWGLIAPFVGSIVNAQSTAAPVIVAQIHGEIDLGVSPFLSRVLREAEAQGAVAVILDINTPGGRLDAALDMKNALLAANVPTIAYVNREAYSAGALIAMATERIYMAPGAVIGAATPITGTGETADEKIVSAVRSAFRSVAETRGLNPTLAEAMVDPRIEVPGLVDSESLLTLTTQQALEWEYAVASVANLNALLAAENLQGRPLIQSSPGFAEGLVRFLTNPIVASLLITVGFLGLLYELQSPGFGLGGSVAVAALALFFGGHLVAGLAGWEGLALVFLGLALLAVEAFVFPGFGIAGLLGIVAFLGGLYISLIGSLPTSGDYMQALVVISASLLLMIIGGFLSLKFLPKRAFGGLVLNTRLLPGAQPNEDVLSMLPSEGIFGSLLGAQGTALTDLHPSGAGKFNGHRVDVVAEEGFIPMGAPIQVVQEQAYRRVVRSLVPHEARSTWDSTKPSEP